MLALEVALTMTPPSEVTVELSIAAVMPLSTKLNDRPTPSAMPTPAALLPIPTAIAAPPESASISDSSLAVVETSHHCSIHRAGVNLRGHFVLDRIGRACACTGNTDSGLAADAHGRAADEVSASMSLPTWR